MKILITGGCGYIGYSLIKVLENCDEIKSITVYDNLSNSNSNFFFNGEKLKKVNFIKGDILDSVLLEQNIKEVDTIVHLAAQVTFPFAFNDHHKYEQVNHYGSLQIYQLLQKYYNKKIIYLSSAAIYGFRDVQNEDFVPEPENAYGISKRNGEKYFQLLKETSDVFILRSANVFGYNPCIRTDAVINRFVMDAVMYNKLIIHGNGKQTRAFVNINLLTEEIKKCILGKHKPGIYNLVQGNMSLEELRDILIENIPNLEFTYVSTSSVFSSSTMKSNKIFFEQSLKSDILDTLNEIKNKYRL